MTEPAPEKRTPTPKQRNREGNLHFEQVSTTATYEILSPVPWLSPAQGRDRVQPFVSRTKTTTHESLKHEHSRLRTPASERGTSGLSPCNRPSERQTAPSLLHTRGNTELRSRARGHKARIERTSKIIFGESREGGGRESGGCEEKDGGDGGRVQDPERI
ncbi:hypothetical protein H2248_011146 [Termitomyces sp. 'cryptogamus']|nr:hypothetical protein H2248_011146 [Termitomyces sp. 'cryptogamus']